MWVSLITTTINWFSNSENSVVTSFYPTSKNFKNMIERNFKNWSKSLQLPKILIKNRVPIKIRLHLKRIHRNCNKSKQGYLFLLSFNG